MKETIYITADDDGCICEWRDRPKYNGSHWEEPEDKRGIMQTEEESPKVCKEKYGFIPENGKCYEVLIKTTCTYKEI